MLLSMSTLIRLGMWGCGGIGISRKNLVKPLETILVCVQSIIFIKQDDPAIGIMKKTPDRYWYSFLSCFWFCHSCYNMVCCLPLLT